MPQDKNSFYVTKRSGEKELFDFSQLKIAISDACQGLPRAQEKSEQIFKESHLTIYDGMTTAELDDTLINTAVQNIKEDPDFDIIATRLLLKNIYKSILGEYDTHTDLEKLHREYFKKYILSAIKDKLLNSDLESKFDLDELADTLVLNRDELLKYIGLRTIMQRYMIRGRNHQIIETPQYYRMRTAMGLALAATNPTAKAKKFYEKLSKLEIVTGGSVSIGSGTTSPSLSNCYLMEMQDSMVHIGKTTADIMKLLKATGGIGLSVTKLRAEGSTIKSNNTQSSGPIPFLNIIDATLRAVSRAGKKKGALCFYMENWHLDFDDFIDLKQNAGDEYRRTRTANTAVYISDEFMKRVENNEDWYLFDPRETADLAELYGQAFSERYEQYIKMADNGKLDRFKKVKAAEQFTNILIALQTTSHPWLTWKDTINLRALNNNTGTIHCSNLCTEITLPQDEHNVSVCNLAYINLAKHFSFNNQEVDWKLVEASVRQAVVMLDDLISVNQPPIDEAINSEKHNRAIGIGLMGFAEVIENMSLAYDSPKTYEFADKLFEFISYHAIDESANLAQQHGSYDNFRGSLWSKGYVPLDSLANLEKSRGFKIDLDQTSHWPELDWNSLRQKVKQGMRNATLLAIAPNANGGIAAGTSPGIDPRFSQMFSRSNHAGKFLEINENLVKALKSEGLWDKVKNKILEHQGDIAEINEIPNKIKQVYKTSFSTSPYAYIEVAARAQKWIDQAISRNMYLATRDINEIKDIYTTAWKKGLKTTYYLHMKPRHTAEQSTTQVNKATAVGKKGFGAVKKTITKSASITEDPQEKLVCESCS